MFHSVTETIFEQKKQNLYFCFSHQVNRIDLETHAISDVICNFYFIPVTDLTLYQMTKIWLGPD